MSARVPVPNDNRYEVRTARSPFRSVAVRVAGVLLAMVAIGGAATGVVTLLVAHPTGTIGSALERHATASIAMVSAACAGIVALVRSERSRQALLRSNSDLRDLVLTDPLTLLPNRRSFDETVTRAWKDAGRAGAPLSLIIVDADHFKSFNDTYGHLEGDRLLRATASILSGALRRPQDRAFRIGGEEFAVLLPATDGAGAAHIAAAIREAVRALAVTHRTGVGGRFTVSMGIAQAVPPPGKGHPDTLFMAADRALYAAKSGGRNQIRVAALADDDALGLVPGPPRIDGFEILFGGGRVLRVAREIDVTTLASVLKVLQR